MTLRRNIFAALLVACVFQMLIGSICATPLYASTSIQTIPGSTPLFRLFGNGYTVDELAEDVDIIYYHLEHYGVPWTLFTETSTPFDYWNWTKAMNEFAAAYEPHRNSKPLMLGTVLSRGTFSTKAELGLNGGIDLTDNWFADCPDMWYYGQYIQAYSVYLQFLIKTFKPKYICMAVEISAHLKKCGTLYWNETVTGYNYAYDAAKKAASNLGYEVILFPSFILTDLYDDKLEGFNQTTWDLLSGLKRDRLAVSSYPQGAVQNDASKLPADYFTRLAMINNEKLIISETGWNSDPVVVAGDNCQTLIEGSQSTQAAYMARLGDIASSAEIVVWWSSRDLLPAYVMTTCYNGTCGDDVWCQYVQYFRSKLGDVMGDLSFKVFGTMGFKTWDGETKSESYSQWNKLRGIDNTPMNSNGPSTPLTTQPIGKKNGSSTRSPFTALLLNNIFATALVVCVFQILFGSVCATPLYSATAVQAIPGSTPLYRLFGNGFTIDELAKDVDLIYYHLELYGVPWTLFTETSTPFDYWDWTKAMNEFAAAYEPYRDSKALMLGTVLSRGTYATNAELDENNGIKLTDNWFANCPDMMANSQYIQAYSVYLEYLIKTFKPKYICMAVELSTHIKTCGDLYWNETVMAHNIIYDNAKNASAKLGYEVILFPSFILSDLYDDKLEGYNQTFWDMLSGLKRDRLAFSIYPQTSTGNDASKLPEDYFTRLPKINNETMIISETGWISDNIVVANGGCRTLVQGSQSVQAGYIQRLGEIATSAEIVVWWSMRDVIPSTVMTNCYAGPLCASFLVDPWCNMVQFFRSQAGDLIGDLSFKVFGTMGFKTWDGQIKSESYRQWNKLRGVNGSSTRSPPFEALLLVGLFALVY